MKELGDLKPAEGKYDYKSIINHLEDASFLNRRWDLGKVLGLDGLVDNALFNHALAFFIAKNQLDYLLAVKEDIESSSNPQGIRQVFMAGIAIGRIRVKREDLRNLSGVFLSLIDKHYTEDELIKVGNIVRSAEDLCSVTSRPGRFGPKIKPSREIVMEWGQRWHQRLNLEL